MKKLIACLLAPALLMSLCACNGKVVPAPAPESGVTATAAPTEKPTEQPTEQPTAAPTEEPSPQPEQAPSEQPDSGTPAKRAPLSEQGAMDRVRDHLDPENEDLRVDVEDTGELPGEGEKPCLVYFVHAYTDEGDHIATVGRFAVGMTDDLLWELNIVTDEYELLADGTLLVDWSAGLADHSLGLVIRNPDEYYQWAIEPAQQWDASPEDPYAEPVLICPLYSPTKITVLNGSVSLEDWDFAGEEAASFSLDRGEYLLIRCTVPEGMPAFAAEFSNEEGTGTYVISYDGTGDRNKVDYVYPDGMD